MFSPKEILPWARTSLREVLALRLRQKRDEDQSEEEEGAEAGDGKAQVEDGLHNKAGPFAM